MLDGLFVTPAVTAIEEALASALGTTHASGTIAVIGNAKLAAALALRHDVVAIALPPRAAKKHAGKTATLESLDPLSLSAVVGIDATDAALSAWSRLVRDGGAIVTVDRSNAANASRRALCAGLTELEQRHAGRMVVTSGLVTHL